MELPVVQNKPEVAAPIPAPTAVVDVTGSTPQEKKDVVPPVDDVKTNPLQVYTCLYHVIYSLWLT